MIFFVDTRKIPYQIEPDMRLGMNTGLLGLFWNMNKHPMAEVAYRLDDFLRSHPKLVPPGVVTVVGIRNGRVHRMIFRSRREAEEAALKLEKAVIRCDDEIVMRPCEVPPCSARDGFKVIGLRPYGHIGRSRHVIYPTPGWGPLTVFREYEHAHRFISDDSRNKNGVIFTCLYVPSNRTMAWCPHSIQWDNFPEGTDFASAVYLINPVTDEQYYRWKLRHS